MTPLQVLSLIEGEEVLVVSPTDKFAELRIHYAETVILPALTGAHIIRPATPTATNGDPEDALVRDPSQA